MVKQLHRKHLTHGAVTELVALQIEGEYDFTDEAVMARAVKICKRSARDTKKILRRLVVRGFSRCTTARDTCTEGGLFSIGNAHVPPTRRIMEPTVAYELHQVAVQLVEEIELKSPLNTSTGPVSKFFEVRIDNVNVDNWFFALIEEYLPKCASLLRDVPDIGDGVPDIPRRIFVCVYPVGSASGMGTHRDNHIGKGAVTLALTSDDPRSGGSFYTTTSLRDNDPRQEVPLQCGHALAIHPSWYHGVAEATRQSTRVTITMFF
jgi:hypothetical protein